MRAGKDVTGTTVLGTVKAGDQLSCTNVDTITTAGSLAYQCKDLTSGSSRPTQSGWIFGTVFGEK
jgi:hypothetical protein